MFSKKKGEYINMAKYRRKPVEIEAFQYDGDLKGSDGNYYVPDWAVKVFEEGVMYFGSAKIDEPPTKLLIDTLSGTRYANVGDYIIKDEYGEVYPCNPDIFKMAYERVE